MIVANTSPRHGTYGTAFVWSHQLFSLQQGRKYNVLISTRKSLPANVCSGFGLQFRAFASQKSEKKARNYLNLSKTKSKTSQQSKQLSLEDSVDLSDKILTRNDNTFDPSVESISGNLNENDLTARPTRGAVLQACIVTSGLILALGAIIRQASHVASMEGWAIFDSYREVSFGFETWHIELIIGLVILISSSRYILLRIWPDFSESSEAANQQILGPLQPLDCVIVAFLPGISEELLFRGALLPLFGLNWKSALAIGAIFGGLHLGGGRRYSYAIWRPPVAPHIHFRAEK
ncbi:uncharacterized protein [Elaeis guineensis]|uniref:Uncharacterized protein LOC105051325 isoform X2 n=1 Tax=Elaeis guineensis var. tenera TaxID=51953 RepID=A0A8N4IHN4_ELAGV|nr:uncharacterized protein LOC105051325 isoform X2 [Elaeis guineensis]XP_029122368.1 uncharacterized protein LOC105051325 isoform X2 [Elaeis guineensis]